MHKNPIIASYDTIIIYTCSCDIETLKRNASLIGVPHSVYLRQMLPLSHS